MILDEIERIDKLSKKLEEKYPSEDLEFYSLYDDIVSFCEMPETKQSKRNYVKHKRKKLCKRVSEEDKPKVKELIHIIVEYCYI